MGKPHTFLWANPTWLTINAESNVGDFSRIFLRCDCCLVWLFLDPRGFASAVFLRDRSWTGRDREARCDRVQDFPSSIVAPGKVSLSAIAMCLRQLGGSPRFLLRRLRQRRLIASWFYSSFFSCLAILCVSCFFFRVACCI